MSQERDSKGERPIEIPTQVGSPLQHKKAPQDPASIPTLAAPSDSLTSGTADTMMAASPQVPLQPSAPSEGPPSSPSLPVGSFVVGTPALPIIAQEFYEISGEFARGGLGRILTARDRRLGRPVAIKELLRSRGKATERFVREALVTARLQHPAIVPVYEAGHWPSGEPFYAMKLVSGESLDRVIFEAKDINSRLALLPHVIAVCEAMAYAHSEKIIHRDLKPANVLVGAFGETVVIDWGLAKELGNGEWGTGNGEKPEEEAEETEQESPPQGEKPTTQEKTESTTQQKSGAPSAHRAPSTPNFYTPQSDLTAMGSVMGTPAFMPPEQALGKPVDARADVYALGAILYHLLSGLPPYGGNSSGEILKNVISGPPMALHRLQSGVPEELLAIVKKAMARVPEDRYPSAKELADDLRRFQTGQLVGAHKYSPWDRAKRFVQRHKVAFSVAALMLLILLAGAVFGVRSVMKERDRANLDLLTAMGHAAEAEISRIEADQARMIAAEKADDLIVTEARAVLSQDPTATIAWLKRLSKNSARLGTGHFLASQALSAGIADVLPCEREPSALAFSPDGKLLASIEGDSLRLLSLSDQKETRIKPATEAGQPSSLTRLAFSPDGERLVLGSDTGALYLVDLHKPGDKPGALEAHEGAVSFLLFLSDGRLLSAGEDGALNLWDLSASEPSPRMLTKKDKPITSLDATRDGQLIALISEDVLSFTTVQKALPLLPKVAPEEKFVFAKLSPAGTYLAAAARSGLIYLWNLSSGEERTLGEKTSKTIQSLAFSPNGALLASAGQDESVLLWDVNDGLFLQEIRNVEFLDELMFSADNTLLLGRGDGDHIFLWDLSLKEARPLIGHKGQVTSLAISSTGYIVSGSSDKTLRLWKLPRQERLLLGGHLSSVNSVAIFESTWMATGGQDRLVLLWDLSKRPITPVRLEGHEDAVNAVAFSPDGKTLASASSDTTIRLWKLGAEEVKILSGHTKPVMHLAFSPDGAYLASGADDGTVQLWDLSTEEPKTLSGHQGVISALAFSPDGKHLASAGSTDKTIRLWNTDGTTPLLLSGHTGEITALSFSPDGKLLASASQDRTVRLWEVETGLERGEALEHDDSVNAIAFSSDGKLLATGGKDKELRLWNMTQEEPTARVLRGQTDEILSLSFSPDGLFLASGGFGEQFRLWEVSSGESRELFHTKYSYGLAFTKDGTYLAVASGDSFVRLWRDLLPHDGAALYEWLQRATNAAINNEHQMISTQQKP